MVEHQLDGRRGRRHRSVHGGGEPAWHCSMVGSTAAWRPLDRWRRPPTLPGWRRPRGAVLVGRPAEGESQGDGQSPSGPRRRPRWAAAGCGAALAGLTVAVRRDGAVVSLDRLAESLAAPGRAGGVACARRDRAGRAPGGSAGRCRAGRVACRDGPGAGRPGGRSGAGAHRRVGRPPCPQRVGGAGRARPGAAGRCSRCRLAAQSGRRTPGTVRSARPLGRSRTSSSGSAAPDPASKCRPHDGVLLRGVCWRTR